MIQNLFGFGRLGSRKAPPIPTSATPPISAVKRSASDAVAAANSSDDLAERPARRRRIEKGTEGLSQNSSTLDRGEAGNAAIGSLPNAQHAIAEPRRPFREWPKSKPVPDPDQSDASSFSEETNQEDFSNDILYHVEADGLEPKTQDREQSESPKRDRDDTSNASDEDESDSEVQGVNSDHNTTSAEVRSTSPSSSGSRSKSPLPESRKSKIATEINQTNGALLPEKGDGDDAVLIRPKSKPDSIPIILHETMTPSGFTISAIVDHRPSPDTEHAFDLSIRWVNHAVPTWETERSIQAQVPELVYKYWRKAPGGRPETNLYRVFSVLKHWEVKMPKKAKGAGTKSPRKQHNYLVQWEGFSAEKNDTSVETEDKLRQIAPDELDLYWQHVRSRRRVDLRGGTP